jgi:hypothetical protein
MTRYVPTNQLRFVERQQPPGYGPAKIIRVLQQAWAPERGGHIQWRDVPLEQEPAAPHFPIPSQEVKP